MVEPTAQVITIPQVPLVTVVTATPIAAPTVTEDSTGADANMESDIENEEQENDDMLYRTLIRRGENFITNIWCTWYETPAFEV